MRKLTEPKIIKMVKDSTKETEKAAAAHAILEIDERAKVIIGLGDDNLREVFKDLMWAGIDADSMITELIELLRNIQRKIRR